MIRYNNKPKENYDKKIILYFEENKAEKDPIYTYINLGKEKDTSFNQIFVIFKKIASELETNVLVSFEWIEESHYSVSRLASLFVQAVYIVTYHFRKEFLFEKKNWFLREEEFKINVELFSNEDLTEEIKEGVLVANAINRARMISDMPANFMGINEFIDYGQALSKKYQIACKVFREKELLEMGCGGILCVNQGSQAEAALLVLHYQGDSNTPLTGLVGKGVMFDSGGYHLKDKISMEGMKYDMCGAANALGVMEILAEKKIKANVLIVIPLVMNLINENACKMGDVIRTLSGTTVEVVNTDAEGRLILCDALTFAKKQGCKYIVDIATLTYSCQFALGDNISGIFCNDENFYKKAETIAYLSGEKIWRLPMDDTYTSLLKNSEVADLTNYVLGANGGASIAAGFLGEFVKNTPWIHFDIVGTAVQRTKNECRSGATGVLIRTIAALLCK